MNRHKIWKAGLLLAAGFLCFFNTRWLVFGQEGTADKKIVRVGVAQFHYLSEKSEDGARTGMIYDYLEEIAKYAGWTLEYVDEEAEDIIDSMLNEEIDVTGGIRKNETMDEIFDFPEFDSGYIYTCIITKRDHENYSANDYLSFNGMRLGVYANSVIKNAELASFVQKNNLKLELVSYDDYEDYQQCLERGEVDAILAVDTDMKEDEKIVARFSPTPFYFAVREGDSELVRDLNKALEMIQILEPGFREEVYRKYLGLETGITEYTEKERAYIAQNPNIRMICMKEWRPYCYYDKESKEYQGIMIDILDKISEQTGLSFEIIPADSFEDSMQQMADGKAEMFCGAFNSDYIQKKYGMICSVPYLDTQTVVIAGEKYGTDQNSLSGKIAAITNGYEYPYIFDSSEILFFETAEETIEAVKSGQADYAIVSYLAVEAYMKRHGMGNTSIMPISGTETRFAFLYSANAATSLVSVIDKTIYSMEGDELHNIVLNHTLNDKNISLASYLYANPGQIIMGIAGFCILTVLIIFLIMRLRLKYSQREAMLGEAYRILGEMANEYLFEYEFGSRRLKLPKEFCSITGLPAVIGSGDFRNDGALAPILESFESEGIRSHRIIDFECALTNGRKEWFQATCAVIFDGRKPVRGIGRIVNNQKEKTEKLNLEMRANSDGLTGLFVKSYCEKLVNQYLEETEPDINIAFMMIDLDQFKLVNDTLGHLGGDEVLKFLSGCIHDAPGDTICGRFGGDEFFLFMKNQEEYRNLEETVAWLCRHLDRSFEYKGRHCGISVSIGAVFTKVENKTFLYLMGEADKALYQAKKNGKNQFVIKQELVYWDR